MSAHTSNKLESWLLEDWKSAGPTVCLIEGMSGIGKTSLARRVMARWGSAAVEVVVGEADLGADDLLLDIAAGFEEAGVADMAERDDLDLAAGLVEILKEGHLLVIDHFDNLFEGSTRLPSHVVLDLIKAISKPIVKGRVILLSGQSPADGPWREVISMRRLLPMPEENAIVLLENLLEEWDLKGEVPSARRRDVVRWLGCNPRAIKAFVGCLENEGLEDLIDLDRDAWDLRDDAVSDELVQRLELYFVDRTFARLSPGEMLLTQFLCVYRKPFSREAIERLDDLISSATNCRNLLISRFFLSRNGKWFSLHPVVRELARSRITRNEKRINSAHRRAADHFGRHFHAKGQSSLASVGGAFIEIRYHLIRIGATREFDDISSRFRHQLLDIYRHENRVPEDPVKASQLLAILAAALLAESEGYSQLRILLVKLLVRRGGREDKILALKQATIAVRDSRDPSLWLIRLRLSWEIDTEHAAGVVAAQSFETLAPANRFPVYHFHASALFAKGRASDALAVLDGGIKEVPDSSAAGLFSLSAFILFRTNRYAEAFKLLIQGIGRLGFSRKNSGYRLFEQALFMADIQQDGASLAQVRALAPTDSMPDLSLLADIVILKASGKYEAAALVGVDRLQYPAIAAQVVFCWMCSGDVAKAAAVLTSSHFVVNPVVSWLRSIVALAQGDVSNYVSEMITGGFAEDEDQVASCPPFWLRAWLELPKKQGPYPAFYFPRLPTSLTSLGFELQTPDFKKISLDWTVLKSARLPLLNKDDADVAASDGQWADLPITLNLDLGGGISNINFGGKSMSESYVNSGQAGAMGSNAKATGSTFNQGVPGVGGPLDLGQLSVELELLRVELKKRDDSAESDIAVGEVAQAGVAAKSGDESTMKDHLLRAGKVALNVAKSIGVPLAVAAITAAQS